MLLTAEAIGKKVKLFLWWTKNHPMKAYGEVNV
jgi:hypothetical protein